MSKIFLGSPSLIRLSSGRLLASHDFFGKEYRPQIKNVSVYSSDDDGNSWKFLSYILHSYFTTLTVYNNIVYAIGIDGEHQSSIIIHRSIEHRTVPGIWPGEFQAAIISCNLSALPLDNRTTNDDPLMSLKHWQLTPPLPFNHSWLPSFYPNLTAPGFLEGSVVILSTATLLSSQQSVRVLDVLRFNSIPLANLAIILELNLTSNTLLFRSIISFPGGMSKFTIRYDPITRTYLTLCNPVTSYTDPNQRNILSLAYTKDLMNFSDWHIAIDRLLYDDTGLTANDSLRYTGFQYVDWQFDALSTSTQNASCIDWQCDCGSNIIYLIRTAYRGANSFHNSFHNSNRITYKVLRNYRDFIKQ